MKSFAQSLLAFWRQLGLNQRVSLVASLIAVLLVVVALVVWSRRPDYQLLYGRLSEKDAAAIISTLQTQGVPHKIGAGGTSVFVPADRVHRLRMDLASKGLPGGEGVGFEIFDKGQFGLSDFVQRTNYNRAIQGELARTIAQLNGVASARVMIVQPENRLLLTEQGVKPTASVFVEVRERLQPEAVNSIRHLVANAVQGLQPDSVAVVDQRGRVLSADLKEDPLLGSANSLIRYRQQVEDYFARKVESMLEPVLGPGMAIVRVSAEIDHEAAVIAEERFDPESAVIRTSTNTEDTNTSTETRRATAVGLTANTPGATTAEPERNSISNAQNRKNQSVSYEINRVTTNVRRNPGAIKSLTAAVIVAARPPGPDGTPANPRTREELDALRRVVINALGLRAAPGQSLDELVSLQEAPFHTPETDERIQTLVTETRIQSWLETASRYAPLAVAALVLLAFRSALRRQRPEPLPVDLLDAAKIRTATRAANGPTTPTPELLNELIRQKPANVGTALRDWMAAKGN